MISGVTWLELFVLFEVTGARTSNGDHVKDPKARKRTDARNKKRKNQKEGWTTIGNAIVQPSLDEELKRFKAIVRHIAKHEVDKDQGRWFLMETRAKLRRLGPLAVWGNQPAMAAHVLLKKDEVESVTENILKQKVGHNPKATKRYTELLKTRRSKEEKSREAETTADERQQREADEDDDRISLKYARIAVGAAVKWKG